MAIPFIDLHTHSHAEDDEVFSVNNIFLQDYSPERQLLKPVSVGLHPWHSDLMEESDLERILSVISNDKYVIAIGETGLDKKCNIPFSKQMSIFKKQVLFANATHKPLIIHCVKAWDEIITVKKEAQTPFVIHGFNGSIQLAETLLKNGFYLSVGHLIVNEETKIRKILKQIPIEKLFIETDESGVDIKILYRKLCDIKNITAEQLKRCIFANFKTVFGDNPDLKR